MPIELLRLTILQRTVGYNAGMNAVPIYLDNNATTPLLPEVADAMRQAALEFPANPASQHRAGQAARRALEAAREQIANLLGAKTAGLDADRLIFTSGGTEANNLAILGLLAMQRPGHVITSAIEHPSLLGPVAVLENRGWQVTRIRAFQSGVVDLEELAAAFRADTRLVSIMAANNETGVLQPLHEIGQMCRARDIPFHTDATQWVGKLPIRFQGAEQFAALTCTAHKFHGPLGIGALLVRQDIALTPQLHGGHQQSGERPGTESVALAVGMQTALEIWHRESASRSQRIAALRDEFEALLIAAIPEVVVLGRDSPRLPNTSNLAFPGIDRQALFLALDMASVACSTGSACASGSSEPSPVLVAMGLSAAQIEGALRFSFGTLNTADEARESARRIINACQHLRR
jgi:cysteine desulfurase